MSKVLPSIYILAAALLPISYSFADAANEPFEAMAAPQPPLLVAEKSAIAPAITPAVVTAEPISLPQSIQEPVKVVKKEAAPFHPFTGKVKGKKVRLRLSPDLEGHVVKEINKNELISIVGESENFWAVEPPSDTKAYVFRSFVIDNVVEGNRVNIRLEPDVEAPVLGHLNAGDHVDGPISAVNKKWIEITPPQNTHFYIAKNFIEKVGGPEVKKQIEKKQRCAEQLLEQTSTLAQAEFGKSFDEIDVDKVTAAYQTFFEDYADFPQYMERAKQELAAFQEDYVQKRVAFLETKQSMPSCNQSESVVANAPTPFELAALATDRMKLWEPVEEALYLSWAHINDDKGINDFYQQQKVNATAYTGIVEAYASPVKNKPGDFILKDKDLPLGYLYSTQVNLQELVGKKVTVIASTRSNNNFAFPAYFVLAVE